MRRLLPVGSASLVFTLLAWGCAGGERPGVEADDASTGSEAGPLPTGTATGTTPNPDGGPPGPDAQADGGPAQPCVKNDDCKSPSLCSGTNGLACLGGFCVPTNKPMNCDDGIPCTNDSCDVNTNACTHKAADSNCPASSYCDPKLNCVQTLTCSPGDSVCDRLNIDACDGQYSCDAAKKYCVKADKPCPDRTNAATTCTASGGAPSCGWACNATYFDLNGDLSVAPPAASNGCECKSTDPNDRPTLANIDGNCDGIVGNIAGAIFVDTLTGNDGNAGTMASPKKTIQAAMSIAAAAVPTKDVYVSKGTYPETVTMIAGVSVFGGYDAATAWSRATTNVTAIASNTSVGVLAGGLSKLTELQSVSVSAQNATGRDAQGGGNSSYGILVVNSSAGFTINGCTVSAGTGTSGADTANGGFGSDGQPGGPAVNAAQGSGGTSACATGGSGGTGVSGLTAGKTGGTGTTAAGGGGGASGGSGGTSGTCNTVSASNGGSAPAVGGFGGQGNPGSNGNPGANFGSFDALGTYTPANGGAGVTAGRPGGGGGGGGSGGGTQHGCGFANLSCCDSTSGGGGGGGGGGCGGQLAGGGHGGGGSFGIVSVASNVQVLQTKMTTRTGGAGGNGGNGGPGGGGGAGGAGGNNTSAGNHPAGNGATGSSGGSGGQGGGGSGGSGGPSVCIAYKGTSPTSVGTTCTLGGNGSGGNGGTNGLSSAPRGTDGIAQDLKNAP